MFGAPSRQLAQLASAAWRSRPAGGQPRSCASQPCWLLSAPARRCTLRRTARRTHAAALGDIHAASALLARSLLHDAEGRPASSQAPWVRTTFSLKVRPRTLAARSWATQQLLAQAATRRT
eukprot:6212642-Pleurochrysis_carterae.AAC.2